MLVQLGWLCVCEGTRVRALVRTYVCARARARARCRGPESVLGIPVTVEKNKAVCTDEIDPATAGLMGVFYALCHWGV